MTTTNSLGRRAVFSIASDLDGIQDYFRVTQEMVMDLLINCCTSDPGAAMKMQERIYLLMDQMPAKLAEMDALNCELLQVSRKQPAAA